MKSICVYCGSSFGANPAFERAAADLGSYLGRNHYRVVYGGGRVGLMGVVANAALACGGQVLGVIPGAMVRKELAHTGLTELRVVESMHERKATMAELADVFIALPGGIGTLEELFEIWTWAQLGIHRKPLGLLNVEGFFDPLLVFLDRLVRERFVRQENREMLQVAAGPSDLLAKLSAYQGVPVQKWIGKEET